jgi:hypothetical protein
MAATGDRQRGGFLTATGADLLTVDSQQIDVRARAPLTRRERTRVPDFTRLGIGASCRTTTTTA